MRKTIALVFTLLLILLLVFSLTGCKGDDDVKKVKSGEQAVEAITEVSTGVEDVSAELESIDKELK